MSDRDNMRDGDMLMFWMHTKSFKFRNGFDWASSKLIKKDTRLLWEDIREANNEFMLPTQCSNLTNVSSTSGGVLWLDLANRLFYLFGGEYEGEPRTFTNIWFFDTIYNAWNKSSASDASQPAVSWPAFGAGTVSDSGVAYYYGGYLSSKTVPKWGGKELTLNLLTSFNMNTRTWSNHTYDPTPRAEGTLHYLPASAAGMLAYMGGIETNGSGGVSFANMSVVHTRPNYVLDNTNL
ncbi:hypothetical protein E8E11_006684 [Didymella keratinophila]|nr:hypothetical protein E8E11_006684 [Didymella keratinophila]